MSRKRSSPFEVDVSAGVLLFQINEKVQQSKLSALLFANAFDHIVHFDKREAVVTPGEAVVKEVVNAIRVFGVYTVFTELVDDGGEGENLDREVEEIAEFGHVLASGGGVRLHV